VPWQVFSNFPNKSFETTDRYVADFLLFFWSILTEPALQPYLKNLYTYMSISGPHLGYWYSSNSLFNSGLWLLKKLKGAQCIHQLTFSDDQDPQNTYFYKLWSIFGHSICYNLYQIFFYIKMNLPPTIIVFVILSTVKNIGELQKYHIAVVTTGYSLFPCLIVSINLSGGVINCCTTLFLASVVLVLHTMVMTHILPGWLCAISFREN
jgi:hypothetical protein